MIKRLLILLCLTLTLYLGFSYPPFCLFIFIASIRLSHKVSIAGSFFLGTVVDLFTGSTLGTHGFFYLAVSVLTILYLRKISPANRLYLIITSIFFSFFEDFFILRTWSTLGLIFAPVFAFAYYFLVKSAASYE